MDPERTISRRNAVLPAYRTPSESNRFPVEPPLRQISRLRQGDPLPETSRVSSEIAIKPQTLNLQFLLRNAHVVNSFGTHSKFESVTHVILLHPYLDYSISDRTSTMVLGMLQEKYVPRRAF